MAGLEENYRRLLDRIGEAAVRSGRRPSAVRLLAVTKRIDPQRILEGFGLGIADIGENRVQEAEEKMPLLGPAGVRCHLIGHLQSNKARRALDLCHSIRSVDRVELANRLDGILERPFPVFVQVRSGDEPTKHGAEVSELGNLVQCVRAARWLRLEGFMTIPPFSDDPAGARPYFRRLRELGEAHSVGQLSMGMSHDFEVAIEEGATEVRIGTALFGERS